MAGRLTSASSDEVGFSEAALGRTEGSPGGIAEWSLLRSQGAAVLAGAPVPPGLHGSVNWTPLGPSIMSQGQAGGRPAVSGRVTGLAVGPDGLRVYAGAANGGVWFSHDGGETWTGAGWEITLDEPANPDTDLYLRVNPADSGRLRGGAARSGSTGSTTRRAPV